MQDILLTTYPQPFSTPNSTHHHQKLPHRRSCSDDLAIFEASKYFSKNDTDETLTFSHNTTPKTPLPPHKTCQHATLLKEEKKKRPKFANLILSLFNKNSSKMKPKKTDLSLEKSQFSHSCEGMHGTSNGDEKRQTTSWLDGCERRKWVLVRDGVVWVDEFTTSGRLFRGKEVECGRESGCSDDLFELPRSRMYDFEGGLPILRGVGGVEVGRSFKFG